jgi:hypothetical protein
MECAIASRMGRCKRDKHAMGNMHGENFSPVPLSRPTKSPVCHHFAQPHAFDYCSDRLHGYLPMGSTGEYTMAGAHAREHLRTREHKLRNAYYAQKFLSARACAHALTFTLPITRPSPLMVTSSPPPPTKFLAPSSAPLLCQRPDTQLRALQGQSLPAQCVDTVRAPERLQIRHRLSRPRSLSPSRPAGSAASASAPLRRPPAAPMAAPVRAPHLRQSCPLPPASSPAPSSLRDLVEVSPGRRYSASLELKRPTN